MWATVMHLGILIMLLITGVFEFFAAIKQSTALINWVFRASTIQIIFISMVDLMICSVFWVLTNESTKNAKNIREHLDTSQDI